MGADGGLNWIVLKDAKYYNRAIALISPLGLIETSLRSEDIVWLKENGEPQGCTIMSRYGTDLDHSGMYDLKEIIDYEEDNSLTFKELVEDLATRPEWCMYNYYAHSALENTVFRACNWSLWYDYDYTHRRSVERREQERLELNSDSLGILQLMLISDWILELRKMIISNSYCSVETWT